MGSASRVAIVGVGEVGGAVAYNLTLNSMASELLLVDLDPSARNAQIEDLSDVTYSTNSSTRVRSATYHEAAQCDLVVITAASKHMLGTCPFIPVRCRLIVPSKVRRPLTIRRGIPQCYVG